MRIPGPLRLALKRLSSGGGGRGRDGERIVARLVLRPGMRIADIGSGFGDFALRFARAVGLEGRVYAVDVDPDLRAEIDRLSAHHGLPQLVSVAARVDDPSLPEPVDLAFLSASFHHLPEPEAWFACLRPQLRPGAMVAILETRPTLVSGWFGHATTPDRVRATMEAAGFQPLWRDDIVPFSSFQAFALPEVGRGGHAG